MIDPPHQPTAIEVEHTRRPVDPRSVSVEARSASTAETIQLLEETLQVSKREVLSGTVRVSTRTESIEEVAEVSLDHDVVDVTHVAIGKTIEAPPAIRVEGDTTIVPVIEERFVVVKQLYLKEELHIRRRIETEVSRIPVSLRRQTAVVERSDGDGRLLPDAATEPDRIQPRPIRRKQGDIMGIVESVIGSLLGGNAGGASSPMGGILSSILGGGQQGGAIDSGMGGGGLGGLLQQFQNAGLGHVAQSWVGNGPNQSVSPDQLQNVFGQDRVNDMAGQAGMQPGDFLSQLSQHLPAAVNGMTPNGRLPDEGSMSV